ncbi:MAG: hypothetical protein K0R54_5564 [Clostridiaceae bacterium]|jgi:hypothetical protein|nr:hypothetical protein [Clostridiaceae bacterium]
MNVDLVIFMGQSNMAGRGASAEAYQKDMDMNLGQSVIHQNYMILMKLE